MPKILLSPCWLMGGGADIMSAVRRPLVLPLATMDSIIMAQSDQHRHSLFVIDLSLGNWVFVIRVKHLIACLPVGLIYASVYQH